MILALNTSTRQWSIAILEKNRMVVAENLVFEGKGHFGNLMPAVDALISGADLNMDDVECVSVATGPGSFTGLRVGLSLAKGICQARQIPIIGISSLRALAVQLPFTPTAIAPVLTSRRGEVFTALFRWNGEARLERTENDQVYKLEDLPQLFAEKPVFIGNDYSTHGTRLAELLGNHHRLAPPNCWQLRASSIGALALNRLEEDDADDLGSLTPRYLRPPDIRSQSAKILNVK